MYVALKLIAILFFLSLGRFSFSGENILEIHEPPYQDLSRSREECRRLLRAVGVAAKSQVPDVPGGIKWSRSDAMNFFRSSYKEASEKELEAIENYVRDDKNTLNAYLLEEKTQGVAAQESTIKNLKKMAKRSPFLPLNLLLYRAETYPNEKTALEANQSPVPTFISTSLLADQAIPFLGESLVYGSISKSTNPVLVVKVYRVASTGISSIYVPEAIRNLRFNMGKAGISKEAEVLISPGIKQKIVEENVHKLNEGTTLRVQIIDLLH